MGLTIKSRIENDREYMVLSLENLETIAKSIEEEEGTEEQNTFRKMIGISQEYIAANLTPTVLYDMVDHSLLCIVEELQGATLH